MVNVHGEFTARKWKFNEQGKTDETMWTYDYLPVNDRVLEPTENMLTKLDAQKTQAPHLQKQPPEINFFTGKPFEDQSIPDVKESLNPNKPLNSVTITAPIPSTIQSGIYKTRTNEIWILENGNGDYRLFVNGNKVYEGTDIKLEKQMPSMKEILKVGDEIAEQNAPIALRYGKGGVSQVLEYIPMSGAEAYFTTQQEQYSKTPAPPLKKKEKPPLEPPPAKTHSTKPEDNMDLDCEPVRGKISSYPKESVIIPTSIERDLHKLTTSTANIDPNKIKLLTDWMTELKANPTEHTQEKAEQVFEEIAAYINKINKSGKYADADKQPEDAYKKYIEQKNSERER